MNRIEFGVRSATANDSGDGTPHERPPRSAIGEASEIIDEPRVTAENSFFGTSSDFGSFCSRFGDGFFR